MSLPPALAPIVLDTLAACLRHGHGLRAHCPRCRRWAELDLAVLVERGEGARRVLGLRVRCRVCDMAGDLQLRPPMPDWAGPGALGAGRADPLLR
jgi:hypothetical protein